MKNINKESVLRTRCSNKTKKDFIKAAKKSGKKESELLRMIIEDWLKDNEQ